MDQLGHCHLQTSDPLIGSRNHGNHTQRMSKAMGRVDIQNNYLTNYGDLLGKLGRRRAEEAG